MFDLDPRSPTPLYEQIAARLRVAMATGEYQPGAALPSVRRLATSLRINPATVVQAYRDLEREGFVEIRQGAGTFVKALAEGKRTDTREAQARGLVRGLIAEGARLGIAAEELAAALRAELGEERR